jgi:hypothetical protein
MHHQFEVALVDGLGGVQYAIILGANHARSMDKRQDEYKYSHAASSGNNAEQTTRHYWTG